ncbi:MAG: thioredoxin family protein [Gemmataceae bacterium]|nr:thioredoxin family protein [Gemmataceae bacterium]
MYRSIVVAWLVLWPTAAPAQSKAAKIMGQYGWHSSLETARAEAKRTQKPLMIVFRCDP